MSQEEKGPLRIRYEYLQKADTPVRYVHGVWAGINDQGEIELSFYTENDRLPDHTERIIAPDGTFGHEVVPDDGGVRRVTRDVHTKLLLNYHTARDLIESLRDRVELLENEEAGLFFDTADNGMAQ